MRASDITDIFSLGIFVLEMIDFRTIIERAVVLHLVLLRVISGKSQMASKIKIACSQQNELQYNGSLNSRTKIDHFQYK